MLHIIKGRGASGKTTEILRRMREAGKVRRQVLLVPEQVSFEMERRFCEENGNQAGTYGEVLSFTRLENRVLSLAGGAAEPVLDEGGRLLVMYAALKSVSANLTVYAMPSRRVDFLNSLLATMDELKACCVDGGQLIRVGEETEGLDGQKLRDLGLIFGAYEAMTARGSMDPRDRLTRLAEKLKGYRYFQDTDVYLDGFTDFTPQQGLILEQIFRQAESVTAALLCGEEGEEPEVFTPAHKTAAWLRRLAGKASCPVAETVLPDRALGRTQALRRMEAGLFSSAPAPCPEEEWDGSVFLGSPASRREEVQWAAGRIRELVMREGFRYREIALSARSMDPYREQIQAVFSRYGIPVFLAEKTDILQKPIFTLVISAMDAVNGGYGYEEVFRYLKTGLTGLSLDECDRLENYVRTWNIWGGRWNSAWTMHPAGYHTPLNEEDQKRLEELNALRLRVIEPLEQLQRGAGRTIRSQVLALYTFLERIGAPEALEARTEALLEEGEPELAREYAQLWEIFCGALEQCAAMLGDQEEEFPAFSRLLKLLLSRYTVASIPASLDRVTAGDMQRLANCSCRALFLLGADDAAIPQVAPGQGLLTDHDRELLEDYGLELSPRLEERLQRENTIVYAACMRPRERLFVTWPAKGESENRPSFLVERLALLFPQGTGACGKGLSPGQLTVMAAGSAEAREALAEDRDCAALFRRLDRASRWERGNLSRHVVKDLYGDRVDMSASRMDQYKSCHFAYFLRYGLKALPRRRAGFDAVEQGTFVHFILERVLRSVRDRGGIRACNDQEILDMTRLAVDAFVAERLGGLERQTPRFRYLFQRLQNGVRDIVDNVIQELRASDFQPILFELGFGEGKALPPVEIRDQGITLRISGFVDRVDGWTRGDRLYIRVVDYKTGRKNFDLTEIWNGLGLQMLLYLFTLENSGRRVLGTSPIPAGVLYLPAREPLLSGSRSMDQAERQAEIDRHLVRRGLILEEDGVPEAMEHGEGELRFLPLRVSKRTGKITGDALISAERLGRLRIHTRSVLRDMCREFAAGNIDADPFWRSASSNACQYCEYVQACQFEEERDRKRWIPSVTNRDFWAALEENEEGGGNHGGQTDG